MLKGVEHELMDKWKIQDAAETYGIRHWSKGYFAINSAGHVTVHPGKRADQAIDLKELVDQLQARGIQLPILLRFTDILRHRVGEVHAAFKAAGLHWHEYVVLDEAYLRPAEVHELRGDASKAAKKLGWTPKTTFVELIHEMLEHDLTLEGVDPTKHLRKPPAPVSKS